MFEPSVLLLLSVTVSGDPLMQGRRHVVPPAIATATTWNGD